MKRNILFGILLILPIISFAEVSIETTNPTNGQNNGKITVIANGTAGPFQLTLYIANPNTGDLIQVNQVEGISTTHCFENLSAGNYTIIVSSSMSCVFELSTSLVSCGNITTPAPTIIAPSWCLTAGGSILFPETPSGGQGPYQYQWNTGQTNLSINNLQEDIYILTITDVTGCTTTQYYVLSETPVTINNATVNGACWPGNEGNINVSVSGGQAPFQYNWSNGSVGSTMEAPPGAYTLTVTDASGCSIQETYEIEDLYQPRISPLTTVVESPICPESNDGAIELSLIYDTPTTGDGLTFYWSTGAYTQNISGLSEGTYSVLVTSEDGCSDSRYFEIEESFSEIIVASISRPSSPSTPDGAIDIEVLGSMDENQSFSFSWSNGPSSEDINGISAGTYTVTATDSYGCSLTKTIQLDACEPGATPITLETSVTPENSYLPGGQGAIDVTISGGVSTTGSTPPTYYIQWEKDGEVISYQSISGISGGNVSLNNLTVGDYYITVTDGCSTTTTWRPIRYCETQGEPTFGLNANVTDICKAGQYIYKGKIYPYIDFTSGNFHGAVEPYEYTWTYYGPQGPVFYSNDEDLTEIIAPGTYCLEITTYAGCTIDDCFEVIKTTNIEPQPWNPFDDYECSFELSCPGLGGVGWHREDLIVTIDSYDANSPTPTCQGTAICPVDGSSFSSVTGELNWTSYNPSTCEVSAVCHFNLGGSSGATVEVPIQETIIACCTNCPDSDSDGIPDAYDENPSNNCIPIATPPCEEEPNQEELGLCDEDFMTCSCGLNNCLFVEIPEECACEVTCLSTGIVHSTISHYEICYTPESELGYEILLQCPNDPCRTEPIAFVETGTTIDFESEINTAFLNLLQSGFNNYLEMIECEDINYCYSEVSDLFPLCMPMTNCGDLPFTSDNDTLNSRMLSDQEWLKSFGIVDNTLHKLDLKVFPNPFSSNLTARINSIENNQVKLRIIDILGHEVYKKELTLNKGVNNYSIQLDNRLYPGVYQVLISDSKGNIAIQKVVHQNLSIQKND